MYVVDNKIDLLLSLDIVGNVFINTDDAVLSQFIGVNELVVLSSKHGNVSVSTIRNL
jgi:hypothetical protein